jgi:hypothetical protein
VAVYVQRWAGGEMRDDYDYDEPSNDWNRDDDEDSRDKFERDLDEANLDNAPSEPAIEPPIHSTETPRGATIPSKSDNHKAVVSGNEARTETSGTSSSTHSDSTRSRTTSAWDA